MTTIRLEFERGGVFVARLLDDEAPRTCEAFKQMLPAEIRFRHSMVCGQAIASMSTPAQFAPEKENQRNAGILPGALSLLVRDPSIKIGYQIYISYGMFSSRLVKLDEKHPVNVFGQIDAGIEELRTACGRILIDGAESVKCSIQRS